MSDLAEILARAADRRAALRDVTTAYRLIDDVADGLPDVTVDRYADWAVVAVHGDLPKESLVPLFQALLDRGHRGVYLKRHARADLRHREREDLAPRAPVAGGPAPSDLSVNEHGMILGVALEDGLSTGLFTDQRDNRRLVRDAARGARVLNLFSYTCSFSVSAALGGAAETVSVDLSKRALERGRDNFARNDVALHAHRFIADDALSVVARAVRRGERYDVVVLDPPSFGTRGKKTFTVEQDYPVLTRAAMTLLSEGGRLLAVTNHRKTSPLELRRLVEEGASTAGRSLATLEELRPPVDHPHRLGGAPIAKSVLATLT